MNNKRWTDYFLALTTMVAKHSKDPRTKVGSLIADKNNRVISTGFNGLPRSMKDHSNILENREIKHELVIHAEVNAILFAQRDLDGCTLYCTHTPCSKCASIIIQSGITKVVTMIEPGSEFTERYRESHDLTRRIFKEAGVKLREIPR